MMREAFKMRWEIIFPTAIIVLIQYNYNIKAQQGKLTPVGPEMKRKGAVEWFMEHKEWG